MANLIESNDWVDGIYQLETSDPVLGGPEGVDNLQAKQLGSRTRFLKKKLDDMVSGALASAYAAQLKTPRNIAMSGDGNWNVTFDGGKDVSGQLTLSNSGVTPGSYGQVTVDAKGRVTAARAIQASDVPGLDWSKIASGKPTTLAGYGIADGASKGDLQSAVSGLVSSAPDNLNTLQELAAAVNNDPKYSSTVDGKLAGKADKATTLAGYGITDAASASDYARVAAKVNGRRLIRVRAVGAAAQGSASVEIDGQTIASGARSYNMVQLDAVGNVARSAAFDVYAGTGQAAADWLNAVPDGMTVIVYTNDEPQGNRLSGGLPQALYRCGASNQVFASDKFQYRSAYILIGRAGCGEGQGMERYRGDKAESPDAKLDVVFELVSGQPLLNGGQVSGAAAPTGLVAYFAMPNAPDGWLKANGAQVSQTSYSRLFGAIGHAFRPNKSGVAALLRLDDKDQLQERLQPGRSVQLFGGAGLSTDVAKFGTKCLKTTRGGGYAAFNLPERLNTKQFTLEGWHMPTLNGGWTDTNLYNGIIGMNISTYMGEITLAIENGTGFPTVWLSDGTEKRVEDWICYRSVASAKRVFSPRAWYHIAFSYDGSTYRWFVDGKLVWSLASPRQVGLPDNVLLFSVDGCSPSFGASSEGYYQDWKVSNVCNYASEFSPPTQPAEYQADVDAGKFYLPNLCGEFIRGFDELNLADPGRQFGSWQKGTLTTSDPNIDSVSASTLIHNNNSSPDMARDMGMDPIDSWKYPVSRAFATSTAEYIYDLDSRGWLGGNGATRPRNVALLACVKY
ncbi:tail fiber protein [Chromobacterium sp. IIBBL 290-4]|uniref:tail fiber protein n=1 Tax=Chromobacterium sp. IIBBL 290-4 TaxID=2953890 RepID=UPI0020B651E9|nr:tail fiber protein [Chromobacterium sp. IIBBL 290-4]UTH76112.1 tail fiber protein [Chromobacterium sp. IIBBL 290-4]